MTASSILFGTIIVAIWTPSSLWIGVDSKVISVSATVKTELSQPKIPHEAGVALGKLDVTATAKGAIAAGKSLEEVADKFSIQIEPQLLAALQDIKSQNSTYYHEKLLNKRPLEIIFASALVMYRG